MIEVYISHTIGCTGWNVDEIYSHFPRFKKGARTGNYAKEKNVKMLDFDFRKFQKYPDKTKEEHLRLAKEFKFETIMSMDLWSHNIEECLNFTDELKKHCKRVLIPIHDYELALPNANWFASNVFPPGEYRFHVTHILGGSPQSQIGLLTNKQQDLYGDRENLPNVKSIDGNQIFVVATHHGKFWGPPRPYWHKPDPIISNENIFIKSIFNLDLALNGI